MSVCISDMPRNFKRPPSTNLPLFLCDKCIYGSNAPSSAGAVVGQGASFLAVIFALSRPPEEIAGPKNARCRNRQNATGRSASLEI